MVFLFHDTHFRDGPNCSKPTYRHTIVYSKVVVWKDMVYRFTVILYSRQSCSDYLKKNQKCVKFRQYFLDYRIKKNGRIKYDNLCLNEKLKYKGIIKNVNAARKTTKDADTHFEIAPNKQYLTPRYVKRNPDCTWIDCNYESLSELKWTKDPNYAGIDVVFLPEFTNRCAYVSLYASQINKLRETFQLTRAVVSELVYLALLSPSAIHFYWSTEHMLKGKDDRGNKYDENLKHPILLHMEICQRSNKLYRGGSRPRFQAQGDFQMPDNLAKISDNMKKFESAVESLNAGNQLMVKGRYKKTEVTELYGVGSVGALSFPSLCIFVGLATTKEAVATAKDAYVNNKSSLNYFQKLQLALAVEQDEGNEPNNDPSYYYAIWKAVAKSIKETVATMENTTCAMLREGKRSDVFIKGQSLYKFSPFNYNVYIKRYGCNTWEEKTFESFEE